MFNYAGERLVRIIQYGSSYRSVDEIINNGSIIIRNNDTKEKLVVKVENNLVREVKTFKDKKYHHWIKYGEFEKERSTGTTFKAMHYRHKTGKGLHGLQVRKDFQLDKYPGTCYTFYSRGKFIWQKFLYLNKRQAYYVRWTDTVIKAVHPNKNPLLEIKVSLLHTKENRDGRPFVNIPRYTDRLYDYSADGVFCDYVFYDKTGRVKNKGLYENNQRQGEWIENYRTYYYIAGLVVPKTLYEKKPEEIDPNQILRLENAQTRAMFLKKVGYERVIKECNGIVIHSEGNYRLIDFPVKHAKQTEFTEPDKTLRILQVTCPSTKGKYFLKIPPTEDFNTCAKARNGTFTDFEPKASEVAFAKET